jgi:hypothetical protein
MSTFHVADNLRSKWVQELARMSAFGAMRSLIMSWNSVLPEAPAPRSRMGQSLGDPAA